MVGTGKGAEHGVLIKGGEPLEAACKIKAIVFDKTGTITTGSPVVTDVVPVGETDTPELLTLAASLEKKSEHPLAQAIVSYANTQQIVLKSVEQFAAVEGVGVKGIVGGTTVMVRKPSSKDNISKCTDLEGQGKTVMIVEVKGTLVGLIAVSDTLKAGAKEAIATLKKQGMNLVLLTGDNVLAANYMAKQVGIETVFAGVMPQEKAAKVKELEAKGERVVMAGDGVNDAPALAEASVGMAMATGTDVAIESAGITLLHGDIQKIAESITLARRTMRTVKQNLFWAFIFNMIGIPVAGGALYPVIGWLLNPVFAGLAMAFSSVLVVSNSLRLKVTRY
jgi:Cu2+-exporting ATPase/Cu+-exporting ATPase